ncbi:MAG: hypothetical protein FWD15_01375 [Alphaproteobacteria bacterium]|nr:hypothetical protein [Alphaproteobacteria bacterium]
MVRERDGINNPEGAFDAVFPFNSDAGTDGSRRYIAGIHKLSRLAFAAVMLCAVVLLASVFKAYDIGVQPFLIAWDAKEREFRIVPQSRGGNVRHMDERRFLEEAFVREYITRMFGVSSIAAVNESNWCGCERTLQFGAYNPSGRCFVCNFSSPAVYETFAVNLLPLLQSQVGARPVKINDVRLLDSWSDPRPTGVAAFMPGARNAVRNMYSEYRIDFEAIGGERLSANIFVVGPLDNPSGFYMVRGARFYFTPEARWVK